MPTQSESDDPSTDATAKFTDPADKVAERSTLTPILTLPPEILLTVFALVAVEDIGWGEDFEEISAPAYNARRLVPLMLTCRSWHTLILNTPALWSTFTDNTAYRNIPLYKEYHARSGSAPIFLIVTRTLSDTSRALFLGDDPAFRDRLRSLAYVCSLKYHTLCYMFLSSSFPILEECVVLFPWGSRARAITPPPNFLPG
ncbi:hypothetical protein NUW54_g10624 [Trametes sanguinea]|uniref:Uncharacterized protein n=1 Tax=Trametes sanguinea TaxID=158606 RepID=A0ACC1NYH3_9APHY|nr:hypothetical protein NUW54_g10624 [Trametes sanguinea]